VKMTVYTLSVSVFLKPKVNHPPKVNYPPYIYDPKTDIGSIGK